MEKTSPFWSHPLPERNIKIGFSDTQDSRVHSAIDLIKKEKWARPVLINPPSQANRSRYLNTLLSRSKNKNLTETDVEKRLDDSLYVGVAMLLEKEIDGLVSGSLRPTADVVGAAIHFVGAKDHRTLVAGHFFVESDQLAAANNTPFLFADCAVMPEPSSRALATISLQAADCYRALTGQKPVVAILSFSTRNSAKHPLVDRVREAVAYVKKAAPDMDIDGDIQVDAALDVAVARIKNAADSPVAGKTNVFIFPTLEAGNISYKLVQRFSNARVAGPLLWGLRFPMSDLSRGCTVQEIVDTTRCLSLMIGDPN